MSFSAAMKRRPIIVYRDPNIVAQAAAPATELLCS
jgi:hypothetical protein